MPYPYHPRSIVQGMTILLGMAKHTQDSMILSAPTRLLTLQAIHTPFSQPLPACRSKACW